MNLEKENLPKHIAIIMDGNRRWAKAKGKPAGFGHKEGAKVLRKNSKICKQNRYRDISQYMHFQQKTGNVAQGRSFCFNGIIFKAYLDDL